MNTFSVNWKRSEHRPYGEISVWYKTFVLLDEGVLKVTFNPFSSLYDEQNFCRGVGLWCRWEMEEQDGDV